MEITGLKTCPGWLKNKYKNAVKYTCQGCHKKTKDLEIHRIKRGNRGGLYTLVPLNHKNNNVKVLCSSCHQSYHSNEFGRVKSK
jgi:ribosomal protein L44E